MSSSRARNIALVTGGVALGSLFIAALFLVACFRLGGIHPGGDTRITIGPDLELWISGGDERLIAYAGDHFPRTVVIDARVDDYKLHGEQLHVARTPRLVEHDGMVPRSILVEECEFLVLDVRTLVVNSTANPMNLRCRGNGAGGQE